MTYKDKIYDSYVTSHTKGLYGEVNLQIITKQFPIWDYYYFKPIFSKLKKDSKILELGCGNGSFIFYMKQRGFENLKGIDISKEYLQEGKNLGFDNIFFENILDSLNSEDKFDIIIARDVFEHFEKETAFKMFELIYTKLNKNGQLIIQVPNGHGVFVKMIYYSDFTHETKYSANSLKQIANSIGYSETKFLGTGPIPRGFSSFIRYIIWNVYSFLVRIVYFSETGLSNLILTQNIISIFKK